MINFLYDVEVLSLELRGGLKELSLVACPSTALKYRPCQLVGMFCAFLHYPHQQHLSQVFTVQALHSHAMVVWVVPQKVVLDRRHKAVGTVR